MSAAIKEIASKHLGLETLDTRHSDSLDFHELAVWQLSDALQAAHDAGVAIKKVRETDQHGLTEYQLTISVLDFELIKAAAQGKVDLNELAKQHLKNSGLDLDGKWVGFAVS